MVTGGEVIVATSSPLVRLSGVVGSVAPLTPASVIGRPQLSLLLWP